MSCIEGLLFSFIGLAQRRRVLPSNMPVSLSPISSRISLDPFLNTTARETRFAKPDTFEGRDSKFVLGVRLSVMELADALPTTGTCEVPRVLSPARLCSCSKGLMKSRAAF